VRNYAIIPTYNRPTQLAQLVEQLSHDNVVVVLIDNGSRPRAVDGLSYDNVVAIYDPRKPPELYHFWNLGIDLIADHAHSAGATQWNVAVFNDDAAVPPGWWVAVEHGLRYTPFAPAAACTHSYREDGEYIYRDRPSPDLYNRMCPWAFMMKGELDVHADEEFKWWWGDTDMEWQLTARGGILIVPGPQVRNTLANSTTVGELAAQAGRDGEYFARKWGHRPW
jgi:glycosyltransferase involved in cell wall biosynthesis